MVHVNIEEKLRSLNFQQFHFPFEIILKVTFMKDPTIIALFLVHEVAEFPSCFAK